MKGSKREDARSADPERGDTSSSLSLLLHHIGRLRRPAGDEESFRYIHNLYYDRVRTFFSRRGSATEECRDLTQETFLRVFRGEGTFGSAAEFEAWLFKVAVNVYRNAQRARNAQKRSAVEAPLDQSLEDLSADAGTPALGVKPQESPLDDYLDHERAVLLGQALKSLPPQMQRCLVLRLHHELKYEEIAAELGISVGTVKAHLHQGRAQLKELLAPHFQRG